MPKPLSLLFATLLVTLGGHTLAAKPPESAKIVRPEKKADRIAGLALKTKKAKIRRKAEGASPRVTIEFVFTPDGRSLVKDDAPVKVTELKDGRQKGSLELALTAKVTTLRIVALGGTDAIQEEKILVVANRWKEEGDPLLEPAGTADGSGKPIPEGPPGAEAYVVRKSGASLRTVIIASGPQAWSPKDKLCLTFADGKKACGQVAETVADGVKLRLKKNRKKWAAGDLVFVGTPQSPKAAPEKRQPASPPPAAPAVTETKAAASHEFPYSLTLLPRLSEFARTATDNTNGGTASINSTVNLALGLSFSTTYWSRRYVPLLYVDMEEDGINGFSSTALSNPNEVLWAFGAGLGFYPMDDRRLYFALEAGYHQRFLMRATAVRRFTLDRVSVPKITLRGMYEFYASGPFASWFELAGFGYLPGTADTYSVGNGVGALARVFATRTFDRIQVRGGLLFTWEKLNASIADYRQVDFGLEFGATWGF